MLRTLWALLMIANDTLRTSRRHNLHQRSVSHCRQGRRQCHGFRTLCSLSQLGLRSLSQTQFLHGSSQTLTAVLPLWMA